MDENKIFKVIYDLEQCDNSLELKVNAHLVFLEEFEEPKTILTPIESSKLNVHRIFDLHQTKTIKKLTDNYDDFCADYLKNSSVSVKY